MAESCQHLFTSTFGSDVVCSSSLLKLFRLLFFNGRRIECLMTSTFMTVGGFVGCFRCFTVQVPRFRFRVFFRIDTLHVRPYSASGWRKLSWFSAFSASGSAGAEVD